MIKTLKTAISFNEALKSLNECMDALIESTDVTEERKVDIASGMANLFTHTWGKGLPLKFGGES